jgi:hypothetical protein
MKVYVPVTIHIDIDLVKAGTTSLVPGRAIVSATRREVDFIVNAFINSGFDEKHCSLEDMVRNHLITEGYLRRN